MLIMDDMAAIGSGLLDIVSKVAPKAIADIYDYWTGKKDTSTGKIMSYMSPLEEEKTPLNHITTHSG